MPSEESGGVSNFWYSFDYGLAHFIILNTETDLPVGLQAPDAPGGTDAGADNGPFGYPNQQYDWFENDLASIDREKTPWVVVGLHRPWYIGVKNSSGDVCLTCQQAFEPLMIKYGVDLYMQGHVHVSFTIHLPESILKMTLGDCRLTSGMHRSQTVSAVRASELSVPAYLLFPRLHRSQRTEQPERTLEHHQRCRRPLRWSRHVLVDPVLGCRSMGQVSFRSAYHFTFVASCDMERLVSCFGLYTYADNDDPRAVPMDGLD